MFSAPSVALDRLGVAARRSNSRRSQLHHAALAVGRAAAGVDVEPTFFLGVADHVATGVDHILLVVAARGRAAGRVAALVAARAAALVCRRTEARRERICKACHDYLQVLITLPPLHIFGTVLEPALGIGCTPPRHGPEV